MEFFPIFAFFMVIAMYLGMVIGTAEKMSDYGLHFPVWYLFLIPFIIAYADWLACKITADTSKWEALKQFLMIPLNIPFATTILAVVTMEEAHYEKYHVSEEERNQFLKNVISKGDKDNGNLPEDY